MGKCRSSVVLQGPEQWIGVFLVAGAGEIAAGITADIVAVGIKAVGVAIAVDGSRRKVVRNNRIQKVDASRAGTLANTSTIGRGCIVRDSDVGQRTRSQAIQTSTLVGRVSAQSHIGEDNGARARNAATVSGRISSQSTRGYRCGTCCADGDAATLSTDVAVTNRQIRERRTDVQDLENAINAVRLNDRCTCGIAVDDDVIGDIEITGCGQVFSRSDERQRVGPRRQGESICTGIAVCPGDAGSQ